MSTDEATARTLNQIAAILKLAHKDALGELRAEIEKDPTSKAILAASAEWIATGALQTAAVKKGASSKRTVLRRLPDLVAQDVLERREEGSNVEYRNTGLI